ncbi:MAG: hypothetical protein ACR2QJ_01705 [Geminicoccaceae bacterium]
MNILHPNGMVERIGERHRKPALRTRYGRDKDGSPKDAESWRIARDNDRRDQHRHDDPLRGRLIDLDA